MPERATTETLLAFDFGLQRIGVAIGTRLGGQLAASRALITIDAAANDQRFTAIAALVDEWQPRRLLVGRPLNEDGSAHEMTSRCERFANQLRGRFRLPVEEVDERFSSLAAESTLRERGLDWRERKTQLDAEAALIILHDWSSTHARDAA